MRRVLAAMLVCVAVAACGAEEDVPEPVAPAESSVAGPLADVLEVRCLADGTTAATPQVRPGRAGVRTHVVNETDGVRFVGLRSDGLRLTAAQGPGTTNESIEILRPGAVGVECVVPDSGAEGASGVARVEVVDAEALWQPALPECPGDDLIGIPAEVGWTAYPPLSREELPDVLRAGRSWRRRRDPPRRVSGAGRRAARRDPRRPRHRQRDAHAPGRRRLGLRGGVGLRVRPRGAARRGVRGGHRSALPDVVEVRCTADGTTVSAPQVKPGPAGVHLRIANETDDLLVVTVQSAHGVRGDGHEPGATRESRRLAPGPVDDRLLRPARSSPGPAELARLPGARRALRGRGRGRRVGAGHAGLPGRRGLRRLRLVRSRRGPAAGEPAGGAARPG